MAQVLPTNRGRVTQRRGCARIRSLRGHGWGVSGAPGHGARSSAGTKAHGAVPVLGTEPCGGASRGYGGISSIFSV